MILYIYTFHSNLHEILEFVTMPMEILDIDIYKHSHRRNQKKSTISRELFSYENDHGKSNETDTLHPFYFSSVYKKKE